MLAALAYNPSNGAEEDMSTAPITIQGVVTDGSGMPLRGAGVVANTFILGQQDNNPQNSTKTDADGRYILTAERGYKVEVFAYLDPDLRNVYYWTEDRDFKISSDTSSIESNFTLQRSTNVTISLGVAIVSDTLNGSTYTDVTVDPNFLRLIIDAKSMNTTVDSVDLCSFNTQQFNYSSENGASVMFYMNAIAYGTYNETGFITDLDFIQAGDIYPVQFDANALAEEAASQEHSIYNLTKGVNQTITALKLREACALPISLEQSTSFTVLGKEVTMRSIGVNYSYGSNDSSVSVTIEPLTDGVRTYDVSVINGCIVYIKETTTG
ncbi:MAG: carboxypeptidase-like regulatory domain-containing protein [Methanomassiliicoccus sp.]|nr:carboxypeptidase-like regulatory domain-containing protein [Methanomassiliicoccus sp.]